MDEPMAWSKKHQVSDTTQGMTAAERNTARINETKKARNTKIVISKGKASGQGKGTR